MEAYSERGKVTGFKDEGRGPHVKKMETSSSSWKRQGARFPLEPPE